MTKWADAKYLLTEQYKDASNLKARMDIHGRFSTNKHNLFMWIFDQFKMPPDSRILELGSGNGQLWRTNLQRVPAGWHVTLTDLSPGMLQETQKNLETAGGNFAFRTFAATSIPLEAGLFDAVIANHMLYHVSDLDEAFSEISRILKPGGIFYASTVGYGHMKELKDFVRRFVPKYQGAYYTDRFNLDNGASQLSKWFQNVQRYLHDDSLVITETEPLVAYVLSDGNVKNEMTGGRLDEFVRAVESEIRSKGALRVTKSAGMFESRKRPG